MNVTDQVAAILRADPGADLGAYLGQRVTHCILGTGVLVKCRDGKIRTRVRWKCRYSGCRRRETVYMDLLGYHPAARNLNGLELCVPGDHEFDCGGHVR